MFPQLIAAAAFAGTLMTVALLVAINYSNLLARQQLLNRRIGPVRVANATVSRRLESQPDRFGNVGISISSELHRAGSRLSVNQFAFVTAGLAAVGVSSVLAIGVLPGVLLTAFLASLPWQILKLASSRRRKQMIKQLPDAVDALVSDLKSGGTLERAFQRSVSEVQSPMSEQFEFIAERVALGIDLTEALKVLAEKHVGFHQLTQLIALVTLQRQTGGNLVSVLENQREMLRETIAMRQKMRAAASEARMSAKILAMMPFIVLAGILVIRPSYLNPLLEAGLGRNVTTFFVCWMGVGLYLMSKIANRGTV